jgi:hypothetical protein
MSESTAMTLLAIVLGITMFCLFLDRMSKLFSDARVKNLSDYFLIFRQGIKILNDRRWLVLIPLGIVLLARLLQFVFFVMETTYLNKPEYARTFDDFFFSGSFNSLHYVASQMKSYIIHTVVGAFSYYVGTYNIHSGGWFYFPVAYALMFLLGFNRIKKILYQTGDRLPELFKDMLYPSFACSILVLFLYGTLLFRVQEVAESFADQSFIDLSLSFGRLLFGHLWLGGLFFAFFIGLFTYVVYKDYSSAATFESINLDDIFINGKQLLSFWMFFFLLSFPFTFVLVLLPAENTFFKSFLLPFLSVLISLLLLFVPMIIVIKRENLKNALPLSVYFWRTEYPRISIFLIIAGVLSITVSLFNQVFMTLPEFSFSLLGFLFSIMALCVGIFVHMWIMASWVGLFQKLSADKVESLGTD